MDNQHTTERRLGWHFAMLDRQTGILTLESPSEQSMTLSSVETLNLLRFLWSMLDELSRAARAEEDAQK